MTKWEIQDIKHTVKWQEGRRKVQYCNIVLNIKKYDSKGTARVHPEIYTN